MAIKIRLNDIKYRKNTIYKLAKVLIFMGIFIFLITGIWQHYAFSISPSPSTVGISRICSGDCSI